MYINYIIIYLICSYSLMIFSFILLLRNKKQYKLISSEKDHKHLIHMMGYAILIAPICLPLYYFHKLMYCPGYVLEKLFKVK